jgi:hypothetical protein
MFHQITTKLVWTFGTVSVSSKNNEFNLNGINIPNYAGPLKNNTVCKVYKSNSQFQGNVQNTFYFMTGVGEFKMRGFSNRGPDTAR